LNFAISEIAKRYDRIKTWLNEYGKLVVNEREEDNYIFSFFIWGKTEGRD
jgi:hypothetical protein